jgi:hypothetical protein
MWQELRDYWLPLMLYLATLSVAGLLLILILLLPFVACYLPFNHRVIELFTEDVTVRRTGCAGAVGLMVTAFVFFRPNTAALGKRSSAKKPPHDTMAGA